MLKLKDIKKWSSEAISSCVLIVLITLSVIVFSAFYLVGYDRPFIDDANFNAPLFTDVLMSLMYVLVFAAVLIAIVAVVLGLRRHNRTENVSNGVPTSKISYGVTALFCVSILLSLIFSSTDSLNVNGNNYADTLWLRLSDMFINTSIILIVVAIAAVAYGLSGYNRKQK